MAKRKYLIASVPLLLISSLSLISCDDSNENGALYNPFENDKFTERFAYQVVAGPSGTAADIFDETPAVNDSTITLNQYTYSDSLPDIPGYVEDNGSTVIIEDSIRKDVQTVYGQGYPIVRINELCFYRNTTVSKIELPDTIEYIGDEAFRRMTNLNDINVDELTNLTYIGDRVFDEVPWYTTYLENHSGAIIFGNVLYAVNGNIGESYTVPSNIKTISPDAFVGHTELKSIVLPEGLETIGANAFDGTSLEEVVLPSSVTSVGEEAFANCENLTKLDLGNAEISSEGPIVTNSPSLKELTYNGSVSVADFVDNNENSLNSIEKVTITGERGAQSLLADLPNLKEVNFTNIKVIDDNSFDNSTSLSTINGLDTLEFISDNSITSTPYYASLPDGEIYLGTAYLGSKSSSKMALKEGTTGVAKDSYASYSQSLDLPSSLKYIGESAFANCTGINDIDLINSVEVRANAFDGAINVTSIELADNTSIGENAFNGLTKVVSLSLPYGEDLTEIFGSSLANTLTTYTFKNGPTAVAENMFRDYTKLETVTFSDSLTIINANAFNGCTALKTVDFPVSITEIASFAFANCTSLNNINFNCELNEPVEEHYSFKGLRNLQSFVFFNCTSLSTSSVNHREVEEGTFTLPESIRNIQACNFTGTAIETVNVRCPEYYFDGIYVFIDIRESQEYITISADWLNDFLQGTDENGNPYEIPYTITEINLDNYDD